MQNLDVSKIDKKITDELIKWLNSVEDQAFELQKTMHSDWRKAELAINQEFKGGKKKPTFNFEGSDKNDEQFAFYDPQSVRISEGLISQLLRSSIPRNGKFFSIRHRFNAQMVEFPKYLPCLSQADENFLKEAYVVIKATNKIIKAYKQKIDKGSDCGYFEYSSDLGLMDYHVQNIKRVALYPVRDDKVRTNHILRYTYPISSLRNNPTIDSKLVKDIKPSRSITDRTITKRGDDIDTDLELDEIPYGHVHVSTFFIPWWGSVENEKFELNNALITIVRNGLVTKDNKNNIGGVIVKILELDSTLDNPILFATFNPTDPGVLYGKSKIVQLLPYQELQNLLLSVGSEAVMMNLYPPITVVDDGTLDNIGAADYAPRGIMPKTASNSIEQLRIQNDLAGMISFLEVIQSKVQLASNITDIIEGGRGGTTTPGARKTKFEIQRELEGSDAKIDIITRHNEEDYLQPFTLKYLRLTKAHIKEEVENLLAIYETQNLESGLDPNRLEVAKWEFVKQNSKIYRNYLQFSGIEKILEDKTKELSANQDEDAEFFMDSLTPSFLFEIVTTPNESASVLIDGSLGELKKAEKLEDIQTALQILEGLGIRQSTGRDYDFTELIRALKDNLNGLDENLLKDQALQPQGVPNEQAIANGQGPTSPTATPGGPAGQIPPQG